MGIFARYEAATARLAWEAFREKNRTPSYDVMARRIAQYAKASGAQHRIGCIMVTDPVFFSDDELVPQPRDWHKNVVSGAGYDLSEGDGKRIWDECQALLVRARASSLGPMVAEPDAPRYVSA